MKFTRKDYYLIDGRLDLRTLNEVPGQKSYEVEQTENIRRRMMRYNKPRVIDTGTPVIHTIQTVYTDQAINNTLKEMGAYFSGIN